MDSESRDVTYQPDSRDAESSQESLVDGSDKCAGTIVVSDFLKLDLAELGSEFATRGDGECNHSESL